MVLGTAGGALDGRVLGEGVCRRSRVAAPLCGVVPVTESLFGPPGWQRGPSTLASQS